MRVQETDRDFEKAIRLYQDATDFSKETGNKDKEIVYRANLGRAQALFGAYDQAADILEELLYSFPQKTYLFPEVHLSLAVAYLGQGRLDLAVAAVQRALIRAGSSHNPFFIGMAWTYLGCIAAQLGAPVRADPNEDITYEARDCFKQSLEVFSRSHSQFGQAWALRYWAEAEFLQGNTKLGKKMWREARDIFTRLKLPLMIAQMENHSIKRSSAYNENSYLLTPSKGVRVYQIDFGSLGKERCQIKQPYRSGTSRQHRFERPSRNGNRRSLCGE